MYIWVENGPNARRRLDMSATTQYFPEQVMAWVTQGAKAWLEAGGRFVLIEDESALWLACQAVTAYHNDLAYNATSPYEVESEKSEDSSDELESDSYSQDDEFGEW